MRWGRKQGKKVFTRVGFFHGGWMSKLKQKLLMAMKSESVDDPVRPTTISGQRGVLPPPPSGGFDGNDRRRRRRNRGGGSFGSSCEEGSGTVPDYLCADLLRRSKSEKLDSKVMMNRAKTEVETGNLGRSESFVFGLKPIVTSVVDEKYPDLNLDDSCRARKSVSGKMRLRSKVKVNSPRLMAKKKTQTTTTTTTTTTTRKGEKNGMKKLETFAVVKRSFDPQKDFRNSMVEMILHNRMASPEELESLLACYLSLNSDEFHDTIVKVFRQVWFDFKLLGYLQNKGSTMKYC